VCVCVCSVHKNGVSGGEGRREISSMAQCVQHTFGSPSRRAEAIVETSGMVHTAVQAPPVKADFGSE
jgi:hypothetical protein